MIRLPRFAIGTVQPEADSQPLVWGLLEALRRHGLVVQHFLSRTCFAPLDGAATITGAGSRYLDTWLMTPEQCGDALWRIVSEKNFAMVEGPYVLPHGDTVVAGGDLGELSNWLDLPRLAVIDVSRWCECSLPSLPDNIQGLLMDRVPTRSALFRLQTQLEAIYGCPVLGGLYEGALDRTLLECEAWGGMPSPEICESLGDELLSNLRVAELLRIAERAGPIWESAASGEEQPLAAQPITIAAAFDSAFHGYFPDALEALEQRGARIVDFSPLRDEGLPPGTDLVWLGCGHLERCAEELSRNQCMLLALRDHVCAGRRLYAEGGGLAYLCEYMETPSGDLTPMAGVFPAIARWKPSIRVAQPVEMYLTRDSWLVEAGEQVRGYRQANWQLEPTGPLNNAAGEELDFVGRHHAIGSRLLELRAQSDLWNIVSSHAPCLGLARNSTVARA